ncbi:unnamed protein product [Echinostoma caproni]|uniref:Fibronectin type-III domain-containing protein n=1 Tax=Echinostoma caproni TaxID=27848 RepID=A0A183B528_9TREM|nr:unnamed protein product [Echinostoma caproni]
MSTMKTAEKPKWAAYLDVTESGVEQMEIEPGLRRVRISRLKPDTQYLFNMASVSNSGLGVRAVAYGRTKRFVPAAPTELTVEAISSTELEVRWKPPIKDSQSQQTETAATRIAYYDLSWRPSTSTGGWIRLDQSSSTWSNQVGPTNPLLPESNGFSRRLVPVQPDGTTAEFYTARIPQLQPGTYYVIHLRAVAPSGSGDRAVSSPMRTWDPREFLIPYCLPGFCKSGLKKDQD